MTVHLFSLILNLWVSRWSCWFSQYEDTKFSVSSIRKRKSHAIIISQSHTSHSFFHHNAMIHLNMATSSLITAPAQKLTHIAAAGKLATTILASTFFYIFCIVLPDLAWHATWSTQGVSWEHSRQHQAQLYSLCCHEWLHLYGNFWPPCKITVRKLKILFFNTVEPRLTKWIRSRGSFVSQNFRKSKHLFPYK